jgi:Subtilase family
MPEHLLLPDRTTISSRRAGGGGGGGPTRNPRRHGTQLDAGLNNVLASRRLDVSIDPDLVFKIRAADRRIDDDTLIRRGVVPLSETAEFVYFVLSRDEGKAFGDALREYAAGPDTEGAPAELKSLFGAIDRVEPYGPSDRRGPGIDDLSPGGSHIVDISIWASPDFAEAQRRSQVVTSALQRRNGTVLLSDIRSRRTVIRARIDDEGLDDLLNVSVIERVRTPPIPYLDASDWRYARAEDFIVRQQPSAPVGVLDDMPATGHPLLEDLIASAEEIASGAYRWQPPGHHGTQVVGRVLFPHLHDEIRDHLSLIAVGKVHVARVLEPYPGHEPRTRFPDEAFPHQTVERAIRLLHEVHGVRIFNLSFGYDSPFDAMHVEELTETIDDLARELNVIIVVPTGNASATLRGETPSGYHVERDYPNYLDEPAFRLAEPAPAALAVTVGSIAHSDAPEERNPPRIGWRAISPVGYLSPFSRTGPGVGASPNRWNKPDFVNEGGNWVLSDTDQLVLEDAGVSVISLAMEPSGRLFRACDGTSFASPLVARTAADIINVYPEASANLVRALLATSARHPRGALHISDENRRAALYGLGVPNTQRAVESGPYRVTMIYDGAMSVDTVAIHPLPMPRSFAEGYSTSRLIKIAMAFDPPVRRQRREYIAGSMQIDLYRAIDVDQLAKIMERQSKNDSRPPIDDRRRPDLIPGTNSHKSTTLLVRTWEPRKMNLDDGDTYYVVIVHRAQTWARERIDYQEQRYAIAAVLEDEGRIGIDLYTLVEQQVRVPARVRIQP